MHGTFDDHVVGRLHLGRLPISTGIGEVYLQARLGQGHHVQPLSDRHRQGPLLLQSGELKPHEASQDRVIR